MCTYAQCTYMHIGHYLYIGVPWFEYHPQFLKQCQQNLTADALCLNLPKEALAGLSADTTMTVLRK